jgi:hypothetical protein
MPFRNPAGTMLGFLDIQFTDGQIINGCKLMLGPSGKHWIAWPAQTLTEKDGSPKLDINGRAVWSPVVDFCDRAARDRFTGIVLDALRQAHPRCARRRRRAMTAAFETFVAVRRWARKASGGRR